MEVSFVQDGALCFKKNKKTKNEAKLVSYHVSVKLPADVDM